MNWRSVRAVLGAFVGIRRASAAHSDSRLKLREIIVAALLVAAGLIGLLLLLVQQLVN